MSRSHVLAPCLLMATGLTLPAQWVEVGDAPELPRAAQIPIGGAALTTIAGSVAGDADMYLIQIDNPAAFSATTVGGTVVDTQLFLFDIHGRGITHNDDSPFVPVTQSTITGVWIPAPGQYYLAVSAFDYDPLGEGTEIWSDTPYSTERQSDGPGRRLEVDAWAGLTYSGGPYQITLAGASFPDPQVVLPDNHYLCESMVQLGNSGSTSWWRGATGGRFQILYEASHFTGAAGIAGPIVIERLMFRGEDGEPNRGGQTWPAVTVQIGSTTLTAASLNPTFALNLFPMPPDSTFMGPPGVGPVMVQPSLGSTPNNYNIVLDLVALGASFLHNPVGPRPNLLIDVTMAAPALEPLPSGPVMAIQDTIGGIAFVRGAGVNTAIPGAAAGTYSTAPPVVGVEYMAPAVVVPPRYIPTIPARNEYYGGACGGMPSTFYQAFLNGQPFDLNGLTLVPDVYPGPASYLVMSGAPSVDLTKLNPAPNSIADDAVVAFPLGFAFAFPGGVTGAISPCTNGYIWLDGVTATADFSPTVDELRGATANLPARLMPCWYDLHCGRNVATHPLSGLHVQTDFTGGPGNAVTYVTWFDVGVFNSVAGAGIGGHAVHTMQCVLFQVNGRIEFRYGAMPTFCANTTGTDPSNPAFVGFTRGRIGGAAGVPSVDPKSRDLSAETPFTTSVEGPFGNMGQTAAAVPDMGGIAYSGRMFGGQSVTWNVDNVPPGSLLGVQLVDFTNTVPGFKVPGIVAPGCMLSTSMNALLWEVTVFPPPVVLGTVPVVVPFGFEGRELFAQYVVLDGLFGGPNLITVASNALRHTLGLD